MAGPGRGDAGGALDAVLAGPVEEAARRLLGAELQHGGVTLRLTEVEAYGGDDDPGSHAHRGRTARNAVMFGAAGRLYVYFVYGMHHCANVVVGPDGRAGAVLLRAGEIVAGGGAARARRGGAADRELARGPARLCVALGLDRTHDGADLTSPGEEGPVLLVAPTAPPRSRVRTGPRVGLRRAAERPWRFWLAEEPTVSAYRPAPPRRPRAPRG